MIKKRTMRIFHKGWRERLDTYAKDEWKQEKQPGKVNPFFLRTGQIPLEFFKKPRNAQEKRKYIKKYGKFLPREKLKRMESINPLEDIHNELTLSDYVNYPDWAYNHEDVLENLKNFASYLEGNMHLIKRPSVRKEIQELLKDAKVEVYYRELEIEKNKPDKRKK